MTSFANSTIAQGPTVGRTDLWSEWQPTTCQPRWLLLSGAFYPPEDVAISKIKEELGVLLATRSGTFPPGVSPDLTNMQDTVPGGCCYPMIFSHACYSGHWANFCVRKGIGGFHCVAACPEYSAAFDTKNEKIMEFYQYSVSLAWRAIMGDAVLEDFRGKDCAFVANWLRGKGLNELCAILKVFKFQYF